MCRDKESATIMIRYALRCDKGHAFDGWFRSAEGFDAAKILLDGISEGKVTREDLLSYVKTYDKAGVTKQLKFDDKGEPSSVSVWAYKVEDAKIVADQEISS